MGRKRQRFDIDPRARFTCDRAAGRGAGPLLVGHVDLGRADFSPNRADPSADLGRAGLGRAELSRVELQPRSRRPQRRIRSSRAQSSSTPAPIAPTPVPDSVAPIKIAKIDRCVHPSPIGVIYNPKLTAKVRRQYEDNLIKAKGATKEKVVANVILGASVDVTTPPQISSYRNGDRGRNDGPIFISLTGGITNNNPFPLSSVSIRCDYRDARGVPQSFEFPFRYTLGAGGYIPYQGKVINELPPRSVVNDISCQVETAEIWQNTDVIQYLNAPLNPDLAPPAPGPALSRLDIK